MRLIYWRVKDSLHSPWVNCRNVLISFLIFPSCVIKKGEILTSYYTTYQYYVKWLITKLTHFRKENFFEDKRSLFRRTALTSPYYRQKILKTKEETKLSLLDFNRLFQFIVTLKKKDSKGKFYKIFQSTCHWGIKV